MTDAMISDAARSPRGKGKETGALQVLNAVRDRSGFDTADVDDVVMGSGAGGGDHAMDIARIATLDAGWSIEVPGVTSNRFCGSGQHAVNFGAAGIRAGFQELVVAGGVESMSRPAPAHVIAPSRDRAVPSVIAAIDAAFRRLDGAPTFALTDNEKTVTALAHLRDRCARPPLSLLSPATA